MKKRLLAVAVGIAVAMIFAGTASAGKYSRPKPYVEPADSGLDAFAEKQRSMSDCMSFSASHKSKGSNADRAEFRRQFGEPAGEAGAVTEYSYDKYTRIFLDCSKRLCTCRCLGK
ncbi:MAG TPA: hypothetical protein PLZ86_01980 [bacterium]|nr:hypothetical protein [bacterium]